MYLGRYMQTESLNHKYVYESPIQIGRLVEAVADSTFIFRCRLFPVLLLSQTPTAHTLCLNQEHQSCTQSYVRRPYGVGLLIAGFDVRME